MIRLIENADNGHYSSVWCCAELMGALYSGVTRIAEAPEWPQRYGMDAAGTEKKAAELFA
jgi:hypothetical protein